MFRDIGHDVNSIKVHKFAHYDNVCFREGHLIIFEKKIYEILNIVSKESQVFFIVEQFENVERDQFCNSFIIKKIDDSILIPDGKILPNKLTLPKIFAGNNVHFIIDKSAFCYFY